MNGARPLAVVSLLALVAACRSEQQPARSPEMRFVRATPIVEREATGLGASSAELAEPSGGEQTAATPLATLPRPEALDASVQVALSQPVSPPGRAARRAKPASASSVVVEANSRALQAPDPEGFSGAVMTYAFVSGGIYEVVTAPARVTDIVLEPGERLMGDPAAGDTVRWRLGVGKSAVQGVEQTHVFIKPTRPGLETNLTLATDRRTYFLTLKSHEKAFMVAVEWSYAAPSRALISTTALPPTAPASAPSIDATDLYFDYQITVKNGAPRWKPETVFDDGRKTYVRFASEFLRGEAPALFVVERGQLQLVNYRVRDTTFIVDRLFDVAQLRLGKSDQDVVRITRK